MRRFLLLLVSLFAISGTSFAASESLPDGKIVIVVKDFDIVRGATSAPAAPTAAPKKFSLMSPRDWYEGVADWCARVGEWFQDRAGDLLVFVIGTAVTFGLIFLLSFVIRRFFLQKLEEVLHVSFQRRLYEAFHWPVACFLCCLGVFISAQPLLKSMPGIYSLIWLRLLLASLAVSTVWGLFRLIGLLDHFFQRRAERTPGRRMDSLLIDLIRKTVKVVVILIAVLFILQNILSLNITSLLAGAGVVGLAIAFAAQETIANVFGSIMIVLDRPFSIGDRVRIGDVDGMVEAVGLRSTQIRSLDGFLFCVPNRQVADGTIENIALRPTIKWPFSIGLTYDTTPEKMEEACRILHEILDGHPGFNMETQPPIIYFTDYKDWSLNISVIVWFQTLDYLQFLRWKHEINLEILRRFNAAGLNFAFPTNTTFVAGDRNYPLELLSGDRRA